MRVLYICPVKDNKIFFTSYEGKQYSCNPKYIYRVLMNDSKLKFVYEYNDKQHAPEEICKRAVVVRHNSFQYFYELLTSKVIISNSGITAKVPLRRNQVLINTWHAGGAYKKVGKDIASEVNGSDTFFIDISTKQTTYFLSSSLAFSNGTAKAVGIPENKLLKFGMPRNDILINDSKNEKMAIGKMVRAALGLSEGELFVLYAPTFRKNEDIWIEPVDEKMVLSALEERFGSRWRFVFRGHYHGKDRTGFGIDATNYPDMQELLISADALITDYSSSIWDFSFTDKPGFLYVPDLKEYRKERDFYCPIDRWPYPIAENNMELKNNILQFDKEIQIKKNDKHHRELHSYEDGHGTENIVKLIKTYIE